ncbi:MAG: ATP-binding protein [Rhodobiaceae bacterium]|nr:ATP-binding protein [Nitratireductor sp.]MCC0048064.1 ATP-binding protein [Rhodobiaceae bacterium]
MIGTMAGWRHGRFAVPAVRLKQIFLRLVEKDLVQSASFAPPLVVQALFGAICAGIGVVLRALIDMIWNGAGPFGLMVPVVLVATLFGRFLAGCVCLVLTSLYAWFYVLPIEGSFAFLVKTDGPRVIVNILAGFFVVVLAEQFRRTMRTALQDRNMLLRELEHRVKNNFASVSSMLRLQMRQNPENETVQAALQTALGRVESYAIANSYLYRDTHYTGSIDVDVYIEQLSQTLESAMSGSRLVKIRRNLDSFVLPRDRVIVIGLLVNEILTNAVKHAFADDQEGEVSLVLTRDGPGARLVISDNGRGISHAGDETSLGMKLIDALTQQAGARMSVETDASGTRYIFDLVA